MKLSEIKHILRAEVICGEDLLDREASSAFSADLMSDVLAFAQGNCLILTGLINSQVIRTAEMCDAAAVLFVRGKRPPPETVELAKANDLPLLSTEHLMYVSCGLLFQNGLDGCWRPEEREGDI
ncbi:MAG: hypothetical protein LBR56_02055 [Sporomusaceae bacterium]|nr:hypothetical protein [Sporomusaceae bacterium]